MSPLAMSPPVTTAERVALATQLLRGGQLYVDHCASCHGDAGEGTVDGPPLVGAGVMPHEPPAGAKRTVLFRTAADVYAFAATSMPADDPASLRPDDYLAVVTFTLSANGVALERALDADSARTIVLHH